MARFGISTHLFHEWRLSREHVVHVAAHGFDAVEVFATRTHFDYRNGRAIADLAEWLSDTGVALHSMHAPVFEGLRAGAWIGPFSNASGDEGRRTAALAETHAALQVARSIPYRFLVVHLGTPSAEQTPGAPRQAGGRSDAASSRGGENQAEAARRSIEEIAAAAREVGVRVAIEVIPNALSGAAALVGLIEEQLEAADIGICLDYGHAHLMGDLGDAIETVSGHLWTTHVHDNGGARDDHLVPFSGTIHWEAAMMGTQKIGYDDMLMFEVGDTGDPIEVLKRSVAARERLEKMFVTF